MAPGRQDLSIRRGDPFEFEFSSDLDGVPEPIDPTKVLAQIRRTYDDTNVIADLAAHVSVAVIGSHNVATLTLSADETAALPPGRWVWDLQPDPDDDTWLEGMVIISPDVSRPT